MNMLVDQVERVTSPLEHLCGAAYHVLTGLLDIVGAASWGILSFLHTNLATTTTGTQWTINHGDVQTSLFYK